MLFDMHNDLGVARGLSPKAATTDNTAYVSEILDMQGKHAAEFVILPGANTDANATFAVLVEESDASNMTPASAVVDDELLGLESAAGFQFDDDNEVRKIGYRGSKRYIRVTITPSGNDSGNIFIAGVWLFKGNLNPQPNPPV